MSLGTLDKGKGKEILDPQNSRKTGSNTSSNSNSNSDSDSNSSEDTESESDSEDEITPEYLESLLEKARQNVASTSSKFNEEEIIKLGGGSKEEYVFAVLNSCS